MAEPSTTQLATQYRIPQQIYVFDLWWLAQNHDDCMWLDIAVLSSMQLCYVV